MHRNYLVHIFGIYNMSCIYVNEAYTEHPFLLSMYSTKRTSLERQFFKWFDFHTMKSLKVMIQFTFYTGVHTSKKVNVFYLHKWKRESLLEHNNTLMYSPSFTDHHKPVTPRPEEMITHADVNGIYRTNSRFKAQIELKAWH